MKQSFIKSFVLAGTFFTTYNVSASTSPNLLEVSEWPLVNVSSFLKAQDNASFKATCNMANNAVETHYKLLSNNLLNRFEETHEDIKEEIKKFGSEYISAAVKNCIEKDGYVFSIDSSVTATLHKTHQSLLLMDLLKTDADFAKDLYKALFKKELKEDAKDVLRAKVYSQYTGCLSYIYLPKEDSFYRYLKYLVAACPIQALYVKKEAKNLKEVYENFKTAYGERLLSELRKKSDITNYFLWGIDEDFSLLNGSNAYTIITHYLTNDSFANFIYKYKNSVLPNYNKHTLLLNLDNWIVEGCRFACSFKNVVVTDAQKVCWQISDGFLNRVKTQNLSFKGLEKVRIIRSGFLQESNVSEISVEGFGNVETIDAYFLERASGIQSFSFKGFKSLKSLGDFFLNWCESIQRVSLKGLKNLNSIGNRYLYGCQSLKEISFNESLTSLGDYLLINSSFEGQQEKIREDILNGCAKRVYTVGIPGVEKKTQCG